MENFDVKALADLLTIPDENSDSEDEQPSSNMTKLGPGDVGPAPKPAATTDSNKAANAAESKDIWDDEEVPEGSEFDDVYDPRPQPEYDVVYKQAVTSEDMFLQMGNKTPATASCEDMVVKIHLPDTLIADVDLDVKDKFLICTTPKYKLGLHLPHPVDSKNGKAQWISKTSTLNVTLHLKREYDFMNF